MTTTTSGGVVVWEWLNEFGRWRPYEPHVSDFLETCSANGTGSSGTVGLGQADPKMTQYAVDLNTKQQIRLDTGLGRPIRRQVYTANSPAGTGVSWQWLADQPNQWHPYDMEVAIILEDSFNKKLGKIDLSQYPCHFPYTIDFHRMTQTRNETGFPRKMKRVYTGKKYMTVPLTLSGTPGSIYNPSSSVAAGVPPGKPGLVGGMVTASSSTAVAPSGVNLVKKRSGNQTGGSPKKVMTRASARSMAAHHSHGILPGSGGAPPHRMPSYLPPHYMMPMGGGMWPSSAVAGPSGGLHSSSSSLSSASSASTSSHHSSSGRSRSSRLTPAMTGMTSMLVSPAVPVRFAAPGVGPSATFIPSSASNGNVNQPPAMNSDVRNCVSSPPRRWLRSSSKKIACLSLENMTSTVTSQLGSPWCKVKESSDPKVKNSGGIRKSGRHDHKTRKQDAIGTCNAQNKGKVSKTSDLEKPKNSKCENEHDSVESKARKRKWASVGRNNAVGEIQVGIAKSLARSSVDHVSNMQQKLTRRRSKLGGCGDQLVPVVRFVGTGSKGKDSDTVKCLKVAPSRYNVVPTNMTRKPGRNEVSVKKCTKHAISYAKAKDVGKPAPGKQTAGNVRAKKPQSQKAHSRQGKSVKVTGEDKKAKQPARKTGVTVSSDGIRGTVPYHPYVLNVKKSGKPVSVSAAVGSPVDRGGHEQTNTSVKKEIRAKSTAGKIVLKLATSGTAAAFIKTNGSVPSSPDDALKPYVIIIHQPPKDEDCCICCESLTSDAGFDDTQDGNMVYRLNKCEHMFHRACLHAMYESGTKDGHIVCPTCKMIYGEKMGNCPPGKMEWHVLHGHRLPGNEDCDTIRIIYCIPHGVQGPEHPHPGHPYTARGFPRHCYLPNNAKGQKVLRLLKQAWDRRLLFTVGTSATTGETDTVVWNEIHHKTEFGSNHSGHGYPDPNYLDNVLMELAIHGVADAEES